MDLYRSPLVAGLASLETHGPLSSDLAQYLDIYWFDVSVVGDLRALTNETDLAKNSV